MRLRLPLASLLAIAIAVPAFAAEPDSDMAKILDAHAKLGPKPIETLTPAEARLQPTIADAVKSILTAAGEDPSPRLGVTAKDITIEGAEGPLPARVYMPDGASGGPLPLVVYYHGGGFVIADIDVYDATPRSIAAQAGVAVLSVEYRRAPENKFPAAHDDAAAAYRWALANAAAIGADPKRIAVMGESAGGNLAINTAIAARDGGWQQPAAMVLVYPLAGVNMGTPSYVEHAHAKPLNKAMMEWFVKQATNGGTDLADPRIDLVGKASLGGLPPAIVVTAEIDPLRSEGLALIDKLKAAGVPVQAEDYAGAAHEFFGAAAIDGDAKDAQAFVAEQLKTRLGAAD